MEICSALLALCAGIYRLPVNSPHKGHLRGALMFSLICAWINGWVNSRETGDLRRHRAIYDVIVMCGTGWDTGGRFVSLRLFLCLLVFPWLQTILYILPPQVLYKLTYTKNLILHLVLKKYWGCSAAWRIWHVDKPSVIIFFHSALPNTNVPIDRP